MADMTLEAFEAQVTLACAASPVVAGVSTAASGVTWIRLRAHLADGSFADAFYNEATGKTAFALMSLLQKGVASLLSGSLFQKTKRFSWCRPKNKLFRG